MMLAMNSAGGDDAILAAEAISKDYPGVRALSNLNMVIRRGEVHALVGENGAGKSTLIRILSGDARPSAGRVLLGGQPIILDTPGAARRSGIVTIFQELMIVPGMTVAENIVLGNEPASGAGRHVVSRRQAEAIAADMLRALDCEDEIDPRARASSLSTGHKQIVEIARALALKAPIIILDEPTASLSDKEADALLRILRRLRAEGTTILYVSHRLAEVMGLADRITVLRGGRHIETLETSRLRGTGELIELMVGRPLTELFPPRNRRIGDVRLSVSALTRKDVFENISFDVRAGEVLGFAGLVGAGRTEIMRSIFGADPLDSGEIRKDGHRLAIRKPADAIRNGIAYIPEDRKDQGLVTGLSGYENLLMASLADHCRGGLISWRRARQAATSMAQKLQFRGQLSRAARTNSGGNQQKIVIGKWMLAEADVYIFDEPTRGIDVGAKAEIYKLIQDLAARGAAVIVVSSENAELLHLCHRIVVVSAGTIQDEIPEEQFDEHRILAAAFKGHDR
ncbi:MULTISPECIES: sugar ABC transporter ATP-binding protein [unclassified Chelatococcus]|uniref:sugar ABC transporter ATP-binding protein n=1 Tax=unclassified Chelatococcus TaxID=2638111 RepID=UPI001BD06EA8|nr:MULTISPECIES: sugar ABC transporter ATP-binding protein [unclassified Chelatococcus]CAH1671449.1 arabinose ABC transporter ATP binding subunit [Hyphomicrobiales bacterium]MBS7739077.1 sugar ABC transporter ATP-binding protein [Chelatococcus sp. HY11]MBX3543512.1 sugar ABC transporter ATP-binding protein [Chelatococcus sp.]MCO5076393.1 sugar ABC transporter ATP-binding protein [Chelatococcus sp.]CAH1676348.1 arabinose ABC transporter ATP binding subunit [Hyphomicrobiales bacterium]